MFGNSIRWSSFAPGCRCTTRPHRTCGRPSPSKAAVTNPAAWAFFQSQHPGYPRQASFCIRSARTAATRQRRLLRVIELAGLAQRLPECVPYRNFIGENGSSSRPLPLVPTCAERSAATVRVVEDLPLGRILTPSSAGCHRRTASGTSSLRADFNLRLLYFGTGHWRREFRGPWNVRTWPGPAARYL